MPIYEYQCAACGHQFEEWQKMADDPIRKCPKCNKDEVTRLVSASSFHLKGGGWYVTDYGGKRTSEPSGSSKPESKKDSASESSDSTTAKTSDSTPATSS